jgi:hypothetical protein
MSILVSALILAAILALCIDCWRGRSERGTRAELWGLAAIMVAAAILRLIYLGQSSLEHLEASYLFEAVKPSSVWGVMVSRQAAEQMHQPVFVVLLRGWVQLFGQSEVALRTLPLVFSILCIPFIWSLLRDRCLKAAPALWAAALTGAAPLLSWYGRDCSPYSLLALASLLAFCMAMRASDSPGKRPAIATGLALTLAFYTHFHGAWVAVTVGLFLLFYERKAFWRTTATTALLCLPWMGVTLTKLFTSVVGLSEDQFIMRYSHRWSEAASEAGRMLLGVPAELIFVGLGLLLAALIFGWRKHRRLASLVLIALAVGAVAEAHILWQLKSAKGIIYVDVRHYLYLVPLMMAVVALLPYQSIAAGFLALQLSVSVPQVIYMEKPDVRAASEYIKKYAQSNHGVALLPAPWYQPILEKYLLGECDALIHARSYDAWWVFDSCTQHEMPVANSIYGFPGTAQRIYQSTRRKHLEYLWVVDIRDHRFGLAVPPTVPQENFLCWHARHKALLKEKNFGRWVRLSLYDVRRMEMLDPPPPVGNLLPKTVSANEAWRLDCL